MQIEFIKMQGIGNDFVMLDDRDGRISGATPYPELAVKLCNRRFGIGADGIILILNAEDDHDIKFRIFNSDGSQPEMCGNGMRCFARLLYEKDILKKQTMRVDTLAGTVIPKLLLDETGQVSSVRVDMGTPVLNAVDIPVKIGGDQVIEETITVAGEPYQITCVSMGNPHAVIFVDDAESIPFKKIGPQIEHMQIFPEKTNVEFIEVINDAELRMRVWERGAGATLACGTGACAAHVAASLTGRAGDKTLIHLDGGDLQIFWDKESNHIFKTGPANPVFQGSISL